jgi:hypothetical protein
MKLCKVITISLSPLSSSTANKELAYNESMEDERIQKLKERAEYLIEAIGYMEDRQGFAPKDLMEKYDACMRELRSKRKGTCV